MAGQTLFRAHKLRLVAQIPGLYRGEIRLRRLAGDIGKGEFQPGVMQHDGRAFWRRKIPSSSQTAREAAIFSLNAGGTSPSGTRATIVCSIWHWRCQACSKASVSAAFRAAGSLFQRLRASRCRAKRCHAFILLSPL
jgi:hypothetical protein